MLFGRQLCSPLYHQHRTPYDDIWIEVMDFGKGKPQRENSVLIASYQRYILSTTLIAVDVSLAHLAELVLVSFATAKLLFLPLSILYSLERSHYAQPTLRSIYSVSLKLKYLPKLFGITLLGIYIYSPLLINSFIHSLYQYELIFILCFGLYSPLPLHSVA